MVKEIDKQKIRSVERVVVVVRKKRESTIKI